MLLMPGQLSGQLLMVAEQGAHIALQCSQPFLEITHLGMHRRHSHLTATTAPVSNIPLFDDSLVFVNVSQQQGGQASEGS